MKTLYLLRHATAEAAAPVAMGDYERTLTPQGALEAGAVGGFMRAQGLCPQFMLCSSAVRAVQTSRAVFGCILREEGQKVSSHVARALYLAPADVLLQHIRVVEDCFDSLLVTAHNPGVAELAGRLARGTLSDFTTDYAPATLAVFRADVDCWNDIDPSVMRLEKVFSPAREAQG